MTFDEVEIISRYARTPSERRMNMEDLLQKVLEALREKENGDESREVWLTRLGRELLEEIVSLPAEEYERFCVLLEAEIIISGKRPRDLEDLTKLRKAHELRARSQAMSLKSIFHDIADSDLVIPAGYMVNRTGVYEEEAVASCPFFVVARIWDGETGQGGYLVKFLLNGAWHSAVAPAVRGAAGIVRAVQAAGVHLKPKAAREYAEKYLAINWAKLPVLPPEDEAATAYDRFAEFVIAHRAKFAETRSDGERWGRFTGLAGETGQTFVAVLPTAFERFLRQIGRADARRAILRAWRDRGALRPGADGSFTRSVRFDGVVLRAYVIRLPEGFGAVAGCSGSPVTPEALADKDSASM